MKPSITSESGKGISRGQKENLVSLITDATRKAAGVAIDELVREGRLTSGNVEKVRARGDEVVAAATEATKQKLAELADDVTGCTRPVPGGKTLTLSPTDGKRTIANAASVFTGGIDSDFRTWGTDKPGEARGETKVVVHEMIKDGDFRAIFGGLADDVNRLCLTQDQIILFVEKYYDELRKEGYATFFLFKVGNELFVAYVDLLSGGPDVDVRRFSYDGVWGGEDRHRVVVPQLT